MERERKVRCLVRGTVAVVLLVLAPTTSAQVPPLSETYPATLDHVPQKEAEPLETLCTQEDTFTLSSFKVDFSKDLKVRLGLSQLVIGHHERNALWAVVFPERKSKISSQLAGDGQEIAHIWLRFHPSRLDELFPPKSVRGPGKPGMHMWGIRANRAKIRNVWSRAGQPIVPTRQTLVVDIDTVEGVRRHFTIDLDAGRVRYKSNYVAQGAPEPKPIDRRDAAAVIEGACKRIDELYPYFVDKSELDWSKVQKEFRKRAGKCKSRFETAVLLHELLGELDDDWVWVRLDQEALPGFAESWDSINASWNGVKNILPVKREKQGTWWAETPAEVGYISVHSAGSAEFVEEFDEILEQLQSTWSLIIDLRYNRHGTEEFARQVVGRFLEESKIYGIQQVRDGSPEYGLGELVDQVCEPRGPWRYEAPVYVLVGPGTYGPGERLAHMFAGADGVTMMGAATPGRGLTAEWQELPHEFSIFMPTALDFDTGGARLRDMALEPEHPIEADEEDFDEENDPVLYRALEVILETPRHERRPGHREPDGDDVLPEDPEGED